MELGKRKIFMKIKRVALVTTFGLLAIAGGVVYKTVKQRRQVTVNYYTMGNSNTQAGDETNNTKNTGKHWVDGGRVINDDTNEAY